MVGGRGVGSGGTGPLARAACLPAGPPAVLAWLMTVAVELGMRPLLSSHPTVAQMMNSLPEALIVAASTPGSMADCRETTADWPSAGSATAAFTAAPSSCCGTAPGRAACVQTLHLLRLLMPLLVLMLLCKPCCLVKTGIAGGLPKPGRRVGRRQRAAGWAGQP